MGDEVEVINDDYNNDDVAVVLQEEPPMSARDKFLFDNLVRTINAHKKANSNAPPKPPKIGEEDAGKKKLEYAKKLEEAIQSITPKSPIQPDFEVFDTGPIEVPETFDKEIVVEKSIVLIPLKFEEKEKEVTEVSPNLVRPRKEYPCKMCDYKGTKTNHLTRHMRKHHVIMVDNMAKVFPPQQKPAEKQEENLVDQILEDFSPTENFVGSTDVLDGIGNVDVKVEAEDCFKDVTMTGVDSKSMLDGGKDSFKDDIYDLMKLAVGHVENVGPKKEEDGKDNLLAKTNGFITCSECSFSSKNKVVMREHEKSIHSGEVRFQCSSCDYKSYFKFNVAAHQRGAHTGEDFKIMGIGCNNCVTGEKHVKCGAIANENKLENIVKENKLENIIKEKKEEPSAKEEDPLPVPTDESKKKCDECDYTTTKNKNMRAHMITIHKQEVRYACEGCGYKSFHKNRISSHISNSHKNQTLRTLGIGCESCEEGEKHDTCDFIKKTFEGFRCKLCPYKTLQKAYFTNHEKLGHENVLSCTSCDFQTLKNMSLERHREAKHLLIVKYYCSHCEHKSYYSHHVGQHISSNHKNSDAKVKRIDCPECEANTVHTRCFYERKERGKDVKPRQSQNSQTPKEEVEHACTDCDYKTFKKMYLESHIRLNHGEEAVKGGEVLQCNICEFQTKKTQCLTIHRQSIHDKLKRFQCSECAYKSYFGQGMEGHVKRTHKGSQGARSLIIGCLLCEEAKAHTKCQMKLQEFKVSAAYLKTEQTNKRSHHKSQPEYSCNECEYKSLKRTYFQVHTKLNHGSERVPSEEILHCSICEFETKTLHCLTIHKKSMHDKEVRFSCSECVYQTFFHHCMVEHMKRNHKENENARWLLVDCILCETKSEHNKCERKHKESKAILKVQKKQALKDILKLQKKQGDTKSSLKRLGLKKRKRSKKLRLENPLAMEDEKKPKTGRRGKHWAKRREEKKLIKEQLIKERNYSCQTCPFETKIKWYLNGHTKLVHGPNVDLSKILTCNQCEFETVNQMSMRSHKRAQHLFEKRFSCSTCGLKSFYSHHIRAHINTNHRKEGGELIRMTCAQCRSNVEHGECKEETKNENDVKQENLDSVSRVELKCEKCGYIGGSSQSIRRHKESVHDGILRFSCSVCAFKSYERQTVKLHVARVHVGVPEAKTKNLNCDQCTDNIDHQCGSESESKAETGPMQNCEKCNFTTHSSKSMTRHTESVHDGIMKYSCSGCDHRTYDKNAMKHHIARKHSGEEVKVNNIDCVRCETGVEHDHGRAPSSRIFQTRHFDCNYCDFKSRTTQRVVVDHMKSVHPLERLFHCTDCPYKCNWLPNLKTHKRAMHERLEYKCDQCGWATVWKPPFYEHMREKHGIFQRNSKYRKDLELSESMCEKCGFAATSKRSMRLHKKSDCMMTEDLRFNRSQGRKCREDTENGGWKRVRGVCCEKFSDIPKALAQHIAVVHERKYRTCAQCGFKASSLYQLNTHKYETHKAGQTNCPECGLKFKNRFNLLIHTKLKHAKGGLNCDLCDFKADSSEILKNHRDSSHLGIVFDCNLCSYKGLGKARLHCHKMRSHAEEYLKCGDCDFTGANYLVLKSHRAFTHIAKSQDEDQENIAKSEEKGLELKLEADTGNQLLDIRSQYPHIQIQGANQVEKSDKELKVNPEHYPHIKINFLP